MTSYSRGYTYILAAVCLLATLRVATYLLAFPFFNNVDEIMHFDLVAKYSHGHVPARPENLSPQASFLMSAYCSAEFGSPDKLTRDKFPLIYAKDSLSKSVFKRSFWYWEQILNYESGMAPLYYAVAGCWLWLGQSMQLFDANSYLVLYWVRLLNVLFVVALILISARIARLLFPQQQFMQLGVPLLLAVFPQDIFYAVQSDALSPVCYSLAFFLLIKFIRAQNPHWRLALAAGSMVCLTALVKISNLPLVVVTFAVVLVRAAQLSRERKFQPVAFIIFYAAALLPLLLWAVRNKVCFGDYTASAAKIEHLGWHHKPFYDWLNTSLLTSKGFYAFFTELVARFWRGEIVWHGDAMSYAFMDVFYWTSTLLFLFVAIRNGINNSNPEDRLIGRFAVWSFMSLFLFLFLLSLEFRYIDSGCPTVAKPYFSSGRLMSAALVPFLILYLAGCNHLLRFIKNEKLKIGFLLLLAIGITASELAASTGIFSSHFNFFALLAGPPTGG